MSTTYTIFIDESGNFSFNKPWRSYVGGWVYEGKNLTEINKTIGFCVNKFNKYLADKNLAFAQLQNPAHLHFFPLHLRDSRKGKDQSIAVDPSYVPIFFQDVFDSFRNIAVKIFCSTGRPALIPNEQAAYIDILRNTLLQLLNQPMFDSKSKVQIIIASRRTESLYGQYGIADPKVYEQYIAQELTKELSGAFYGEKPEIHILFDDARKLEGLIVADFYCGAMRWDQDNYLEKYDNKLSLSFAEGYRNVGSREVQRLQHLQEINAVAAAVRCADILSGDSGNSEVEHLLRSIMASLSEVEKENFCQNMIDLFYETLVEDTERYSHLLSMNRLIKMLYRILPDDKGSMSRGELRLLAALQMNKIRIASHSGQTNVNLISQYTEFLEEYGEKAFNNQMEIMQQRIDAILMGVQVQAFNTFRFNDIEAMIKDVKERYYKMFEDRFVGGNLKDENVARLEGTMGQMYGFLYDLEKDDIYFDFAVDCLEKDINACIEGTPFWRQAVGYLVTLYWKNENFEECKKQFIKEANIINDDQLLNLNHAYRINPLKKPFLFLHRLYLCVLAMKMGEEVAGLDTSRKALLSKCNVHQYPHLLSAKWLSIMYEIQGRNDEAIDILNKALDKGGGGVTLDVVRLPLAVLRHFILKKVGRRSNFNCKKEVQKFGSQHQEIDNVLIKLGIEKYYASEENWNAYEIGILLPFYYS